MSRKLLTSLTQFLVFILILASCNSSIPVESVSEYTITASDNYDALPETTMTVPATPEAADNVPGNTSIVVPFNPYGELNPFGVWEVVESIQAKENPIPEIEPWPEPPLENGKQLVISANTFVIEPYPGMERKREQFIALEYRYADINRVFRYHFSNDAQGFIYDRVPFDSCWVEFYFDEVELEYLYSFVEVCFIDYNTILYCDWMYVYVLKRICAFESTDYHDALPEASETVPATPGTTENLPEIDKANESFDPYGELNPFGVWEIVDSMLASDNPAPEAEPWPDAPLVNGKQIVIKANTFTVDPYPGDERVVTQFIPLEYLNSDWNRIDRYRYTLNAQSFFCDRVPRDTCWVEFYVTESDLEYQYTDISTEICFANYDTIIYSDGMYIYELKRVEAFYE